MKGVGNDLKEGGEDLWGVFEGRSGDLMEEGRREGFGERRRVLEGEGEDLSGGVNRGEEVIT